LIVFSMYILYQYMAKAVGNDLARQQVVANSL